MSLRVNRPWMKGHWFVLCVIVAMAGCTGVGDSRDADVAAASATPATIAIEWNGTSDVGACAHGPTLPLPCARVPFDDFHRHGTSAQLQGPGYVLSGEMTWTADSPASEEMTLTIGAWADDERIYDAFVVGTSPLSFSAELPASAVDATLFLWPDATSNYPNAPVPLRAWVAVEQSVHIRADLQPVTAS